MTEEELKMYEAKVRDLKNCPFCGGKARLVIDEYETRDKYFIECMDCFVDTMNYETVEEAVNVWNRRV